VHDQLVSPDWIFAGLTLIAAVTMLQLVFVLPVRPPLTTGERRARVPIWVRLLLASSLSTAFGLTLTVAIALLNLDDLMPFFWNPVIVFWVCWLVGLVPAIPVIAWLCRKQLPPIISVFIAAFCTGLLACTVAFSIMALVQHVADVEIYSENTWPLVTGVPLILGWIVATPLLYAFVRKRDTETALKKLASLIFVGTAVETLAIIPLDVFVRRKSDCYCAEGTFWSLVTLVPLGFVALGPMIFLVAASKRRKRFAQGRCEICGYDMSATPKAARCPECGVGWKPIVQGAAREAET